jgi:hypothetical protein
MVVLRTHSLGLFAPSILQSQGKEFSAYLKSRFSLTRGQYPHQLKF